MGSGALLGALFSTAHSLLETSSWGSRFPALLTELYSGKLPTGSVSRARGELRKVREELARFPPGRVVWDHEDPDARPPWGTTVAPTITSLANYFWTSEGEPLLDVLETALSEAERNGSAVEIR